MLRNRYEKGGAAMTRQEAVDRLCDVYAGSYDVTRCEENEHALAATMDFYATAEKYVLSKRPSSGRPTALNMCTSSMFPI